jgi:hypothetical protein
MKKYGVFLAAAALGALPLSAGAFGGRMGGGRPAVAMGRPAVGPRVFNRPGFGHEFRGPGRGSGLAFGHDGGVHGHEFDFVGFGSPYPYYYPYAYEGYPYAEPYSGDGYGPVDAAAYPNGLAEAVQSELARRGDDQTPTDRVISPAGSQPPGSRSGPHYADSSNGPVIAGEQQKNFRPAPNKPAAPRANASMLETSATAAARGGVFDKLVLVSWLEDSGKDLILVENTETNEVQQITSQPNKDHFRIVEMHLNANQRLTEVVISNGSEQGPVKFRFETPIAGSPPASPAPFVRGVPGQMLTE